MVSPPCFPTDSMATMMEICSPDIVTVVFTRRVTPKLLAILASSLRPMVGSVAPTEVTYTSLRPASLAASVSTTPSATYFCASSPTNLAGSTARECLGWPGTAPPGGPSIQWRVTGGGDAQPGGRG